MTKYSEIEIETAKNMLRFGYRWIVRNNGVLFVHRSKPYKSNTDWWRSDGEIGIAVCDFVPIFENIQASDKEPVSLESIVHPQVLDDAEKRYLSAVIRPFRDQVVFICKVNFLKGAFQHIVIGITNDEDIALPSFKSGTMYKGMKPDHGYSLEELGL